MCNRPTLRQTTFINGNGKNANSAHRLSRASKNLAYTQLTQFGGLWNLQQWEVLVSQFLLLWFFYFIKFIFLVSLQLHHERLQLWKSTQIGAIWDWFQVFQNLWIAKLITFANFCELGTYLPLPKCRFYVITCICVWIWDEMERLKAVLGERVLHQAGVAMNTIFNLWPRYTLGLLVDLVVGTLQIALPGSNFGSDATYLHSMGPVATFLCGCSSGAFFLALAPGFIAGIGLSMWFSQYMEHRSLARRRKVVPQKTAYLLSAP